MKFHLDYNLEEALEDPVSLQGIMENVVIYSCETNEERRAILDEMRSKVKHIPKADEKLREAVQAALLKNHQFVEENKVVARFTYSFDDFCTAEPYAVVFSYAADRFAHETELNKMVEEAKKVGYTCFKKTYREYIKSMRLKNQSNDEHKNPSDFPDQPIELDCGQWLCDWQGVHMVDGSWGRIEACCHPIMPVERLVNIDTGDEKINLAYCKTDRWRNIIVSKEVTAVASKITQLAVKGIAVTSENAKALVKYLCDIEHINMKVLPERESVSRLGYVGDDQFSPFVDGLIFDGDAAYSHVFRAISQAKGNSEDWLKVAKKVRQESLSARLMLAASFASPLIKHVGGLPFFVHMWSCESGTGKTVALMVAASVWGNPELGTYIQSFNSTVVGHEKMAAFLNNIPMCIDELQLAKDHHGNSRFDVYQLAQGVGRTRGNKSGGVDITPTWLNTILTTGETPIVKEGAGAGAINRVIDLEVPIGEKVIRDGQGVANAVKANYGWAGRKFIKEFDPEEARKLYEMYFETLSRSDTTEKQAMAAALILAADAVSTKIFFHEEQPLTVAQIQPFLKRKSAVNLGERGYRFICDWVSVNIQNFIGATDTERPARVFGIKGEVDACGTEWIYINRAIFREAVESQDYNVQALLSYMRSMRLIKTRGYHLTLSKRILGVRTECVCMKMPDIREELNDEVDDTELI